jgi:hypothetical protein
MASRLFLQPMRSARRRRMEGPSISVLTGARFTEDTAIPKDRCARCNHGVATLEILLRVGFSCVDTDQRATNMLPGSKRGALLANLSRY